MIARGTLNSFAKNRVPASIRSGVKGHLDAWHAEVAKANWKNSAQIKQQYRSAIIVSSERVVFNIKGNSYRLVVSVEYRLQIVFILWIGTHREYDNIDVEKVRYEQERYKNSPNPH